MTTHVVSGARASIRPRVGVVVNSRARRTEAGRAYIDRLQRTLGDLGRVVATEDLSALDACCRDWVDQGVQYWVADGGDGAVNWLINALRRVSPSALAAARLVPTNGGTINFVGAKLGLRGDADGVLLRLASALRQNIAIEEVRVDSLHILGWDQGGRAHLDVLGFAAAIAGVGQKFFDLYYAEDDPGPATIVKVVGRVVSGVAAKRIPTGGFAASRATVDALFEPHPVRVTMDAETLGMDAVTVLNAGAFDINLGGVFRVFPLAKESGTIHMQVGNLTPKELIANLPRLAAGRLIRGKAFVERSASHLRVDATGGRLLSPILDGERLPVAVSIQLALGPPILLARP